MSLGAAGTLTMSTPLAMGNNALTVGTASITMTAGDITTTSGNMIMGTAGNGLKILATGGSADTIGQAVLVAGTKTVNTTAALTASNIFLTNSLGAAVASDIGKFYVSAISNESSFTITSTDADDTSTISWLIINTS